MHQHPIHVFINKAKYELREAAQTGAALKHLAGIDLSHVLFRQRPGDDEVITNDMTVTLKNGDHLHSQPPADYGLDEATLVNDTGLSKDRVMLHQGTGGWRLLEITDYPLPAGFEPHRVQLLLKLPPAFPDAAPDMFWVFPPVKTPNGRLPRATCAERMLGRDWQRFSWHLSPGAWKPGVSDLRDFLRCVAARFLRLD